MANPNSPPIGPIFGSVIKRHRKRVDISQEELAFRAGVDRTFVSRLENGTRQPTITTIIALAEALEVSAVDLVRETEVGFFKARKKKA